MLSGRKYRLEFNEPQREFAESIGGAVRYLWNIALEQRRYYLVKGGLVSYAEQCRQLTEVRAAHESMRAVPVHCLQQALRDLDKACKRHGTWKVCWKSRAKTTPAFRYPDPKQLRVERLNRKWARVKLPKFGWVSFRVSRPLGGVVESATVARDGDHWFIAFLVDDGIETPPHALPATATGVDRGVVSAAVTAAGEFFDRRHAGLDAVSSKEAPTKEELDGAQGFLSPGELERLVRLQRRLARCAKGSNRRQRVKGQIGDLYRRVRYRRSDFNAQCAHRLTRDYALVGLEKLNTKAMTASAAGTIEQPGVNVAQKRGLNRSILNKGWYGLEVALRSKARYTGTQVIVVDPAYTSRTCSEPDCGKVDAASRESQARFVCTACGFIEHADVNAGTNIKHRTLVAAGLAVPGRGDLQASAGSVKRQPPANS
jgi:IS605 OrfB family transposase